MLPHLRTNACGVGKGSTKPCSASRDQSNPAKTKEAPRGPWCQEHGVSARKVLPMPRLRVQRQWQSAAEKVNPVVRGVMMIFVGPTYAGASLVLMCLLLIFAPLQVSGSCPTSFSSGSTTTLFTDCAYDSPASSCVVMSCVPKLLPITLTSVATTAIQGNKDPSPDYDSLVELENTAAGAARTFRVSGGGTLVLKRLKLTGGRVPAQSALETGAGGSILATGTSTRVEITQCYLKQDTSNQGTAYKGGAVALSDGAQLSMTSSIIYANYAVSPPRHASLILIRMGNLSPRI